MRIKRVFLCRFFRRRAQGGFAKNMPIPSGAGALGPLATLEDCNAGVVDVETDVPESLGHVERLVELRFARLRQQLLLDFEARLQSLEAAVASIDDVAHQKSLKSEEQVDIGPGNSGNGNHMSPVSPEPSEGKSKDGSQSLDVRKAEEEEVTEVCFEESVWTVPILLCLSELYIGWFDTLFAATLILLNLAMQASFSGILLSRAFMGEDFVSKISSAKIWRTSVAHDYKHLDLADTSLVSRVCNGDEALILSTNQATLIEQINSFLGLQTSEFYEGAFQPGVLLCMLCVVLWTLCVYKEFRLIWMQFEMVLAIPRGRRTSFHRRAFRQISCGRVVMMLVVGLARAAIASILMVAGILWLSRTTSIQELMLNAVALNAILDVDEFLFVGMTPAKINEAVRKLKPRRVNYSHQRSQTESAVHFASLLVVVVLSYVLLLEPLKRAMLDVKTEMCYGNQTFVVSYNAETQRTIGLVTVPSRDIGNDSISEIAVDAHKAISPESTPKDGFATYITFAPNIDLFQERRSRSMKEEATAFPFCVEARLLNASGDLYGDPSMQPLATQLVKTAAATVGRQDATSCQELQDMCHRLDARLLRLVCGQTCECTDPFSSPWYKTEAQGCSSTCLRLARRNKPNNHCEDVSASHAGWRNFWARYPDVAAAYFEGAQSSQHGPIVNQTMSRMLSGGCEALRRFPTDALMDTEWCEGMPDLFRPLAHLCPQSCGCNISAGAALPSYCPISCNFSQ
ncbi:unnamed protein product [Effrenium voratum]|nr:unnamed protein product [Effrenium voratum]